MMDMNLSVTPATEADTPAIALLQIAVAEHLTAQYGQGHWSSPVTAKSVLRAIRTSRVLVVRQEGKIIATVRLASKKPWAIDLSYFTAVPKAIYLHSMAVIPDLQRQGVGKYLLNEAVSVARTLSVNAIRLDAYDADAGADAFYAKGGFREVGRVVYRKVPLVYFELLL
jgi:GNAT superfamily N-acetyltransferase